MKRGLIVLLTTLFMSGCAANQALNDMNNAKAAYQDCVAQHPQDAATACKRAKAAYEYAEQTYEGAEMEGNSPDADTNGH